LITSTNLFETTHIIRRRIEVTQTSCTDFRKRIKYKISCPVVAEIFHADTRSDMTKPIAVHRIYENAIKLSCILWHRIFRKFNSPKL